MGVHEQCYGQDTATTACKGADWEGVVRGRGEGEDQVRGGTSDVHERPNHDVRRISQACLSPATVMQLELLPPAAA